MTNSAVPITAALHLEQRDGRLWVLRGEERTPVKPTRCFPWSAPDRFVSLQDNDGKEVGLVADPADLEESSRQALLDALAHAGFIFEVEEIFAVEEEIEIRTWSVRTKQGTRSFQTARDAWPRQLPSGDYLVRDVSGDLYRIGAPDSLDARSRRHVWAFVE